MLRLERMDLVGFKSFSDRTDVRFPGGITAIVGPNGCGKSNIGDAINWVLGEQSAKMLRGKQMADVIFNGSRARKPLGMAEVSLHLSGAEGLVHENQGRVIITRRLFRSGESGYLLNGKRSRLKDIQELLNQGRVGARTYATIEQGKIDQIVNAKPRDRRQIIEDAAGIAGYKHKRRLTELKLEATQANLLRVNDILVEVERQIRSLKRQASKARRYRKLREDLRGWERTRFALRARDLERELSRSRQAEGEARAAEAEAAAQLGRQEAELVAERDALDQVNRTYRETAERLHQTELQIDREESQIRSCKERIVELDELARRRGVEGEELTRRLEQARGGVAGHREEVDRGAGELHRVLETLSDGQRQVGELETRHQGLRDELEALRRAQFESMSRASELRNRLAGLEEGLQRSRAHHARLAGEMEDANQDWSRLRDEATALAEQTARQRETVAELGQECERIDRELGARRAELAESSSALAAARESEQSTAARLATLEDVATRFAGVSDGVRTLLTEGRGSGVETHGVVADYIEAGAEVESAAEGYLRWFLPAVIVEDDTHVERASRLLRASGAGQTLLISRGHPSGGLAVGSPPEGNGHGPIPAEVVEDPRVRGKLRESLHLRASANGVLRDRLGDAILVDDLAAALDLHRRYPSADYLTVDGEVVYASGIVATGGRQEGDRGLLAHNRRLDVARRECAGAAEVAATAETAVEAARSAVAQLEGQQVSRREALEEARRVGVALEHRAQRSNEDGERTGRRKDVLGDELAALQEETARLSAEREELLAELERSDAVHAGGQRKLDERGEALAQVEAELKQLGEAVATLRAEAAARQQRQETSEQEQRRLEDAAADYEKRLGVAHEESETARRRAGETRATLETSEKALLGRLEELERLRADSGRLERDAEERQRGLAARDGRLKSSRAGLEGLREASREAELERTRAEADRAHLDDLCRQELGVPAGEALRATTSGTDGQEGQDRDEAGEEAAPVDLDQVDLEALEGEIAAAKERLEAMGPVNMTAIDEFSELEERHGFLAAQRQDLEQSMSSLRDQIRRLNRTSRELFVEVFEAVRESYREIFQVLFNGGRADLRLEEGEDVLECGIEIMAQPPGKRLGSVQLLSGGEKALSALALLFAVFRHQPSPFCVLDEVDAALDDANVGRFAKLLKEYNGETQFIVVTHNKLSMEVADLLYGVTMEEPGVSKVVSMQLQ